MRSLRPPMDPCDDEFTRDHAPDENRPSVFIAIVHSASGAWLAGVSDSLDGVLAVIELFAELDENWIADNWERITDPGTLRITARIAWRRSFLEDAGAGFVVIERHELFVLREA